MQSLGEIDLRAPAVGAKIGVFCMSRSGLPAHGGHSSNKYCVTAYKSILMPFSAIFFSRACSVRRTTWFSFMSPGGVTIFAKLPSKITKSPKIGGKVCAHHFV